MSHPKALTGLSMNDIQNYSQSRANEQAVAKVTPSDGEFKRWVVDMAGTQIEIAPNVLFRDVVNIDATRQGIDGTTIQEQYATSLYDYALLKLGVHVGKGSALETHCSANELVFQETGHRGGRTGGLFQKIADTIFVEGAKSETGFVRVNYGDSSATLSVAKPTFFVGAQNQPLEVAPDVMWGQMIKSDAIPAAPAVQLSKHAQQFIVNLKAAGLNDTKLKHLRIEAVPFEELSVAQRAQAETIMRHNAEGETAAGWATEHVSQSARKRV